ncbi:MAG TPA: phasin superfamily protein [Geobacterales bacterium]|jgi:polyhydroxyalkanoate synthesis regulator phasin|nr:phasin superfamily protein [Geobacterales bacterium]
MFEQLEKALMTGLGALSITQKKGEELVAEMRERYKMSEEEGKALLEKMQKARAEGESKLAEMVQSEMKRLLDKVGLVTREDYEQLQKRIAALEETIRSHGH